MSETRTSEPGADLVELRRLLDTMATLRGPEGCPWDREQTFRSLRPHVIEEAHELVEAIESGDPEAIREECGDLLLQVVFLARIAAEEGRFGMAEVARGIADKLIRRHPHVFGDGPRAANSGEALASWEAAKAREADARPPDATPSSPSIRLRAAKAHRAVAALESALSGGEGRAGKQAFGELLLQVADAAKRAGVDPETALRARVQGDEEDR